MQYSNRGGGKVSIASVLARRGRGFVPNREATHLSVSEKALNVEV